ncbi:MAG: hypothetical protein ACI4M9_08005 [Succinivibrio sp.]
MLARIILFILIVLCVFALIRGLKRISCLITKGRGCCGDKEHCTCNKDPSDKN